MNDSRVELRLAFTFMYLDDDFLDSSQCELIKIYYNLTFEEDEGGAPINR